ncbi:MAG: arginine--tRNA ligase [Elusimicrobia bacterium RIFOXYA2_FULL_39_19]|nr:MAG: arginine--tRNA ligase [Elusimicrobia bacterium RIFOXYA2_FULL_39_19]
MAQSTQTYIQVIKEQIASRLALEKGFEFTLEVPPGNIHADLSTNIALILAKKNKTNPKTIAEELIAKLQGLPYFEKIEFLAPGFINFHFKISALKDEFNKILTLKDKYPEINLSDNKPVLIDFVSSNPTGPLHIGHGRGAVIGDSLAKIYTQLGYKVLKEYYINDVGTQIDFLAESVLVQAKIQKNEDVSSFNTEKHYKGSYIADVAKALLEKHNNQIPEISVIKEFAVDKIMDLIKQDLKDFNVAFDSFINESMLHKDGTVAKIIDSLNKKDMLYEKDGALWFKSDDIEDEKDRVVKRQDGKYTYFGADIAYHWYKFNRGYKRLINIWGCDHHGYVPRVKSAVKALGENPEDVDVLLYQLVSLSRNGVRIKMSTRAGEFVTLKEVVDEIGSDAARYFMSTKTPGTHLEFDLELAKKKATENPIFYIQYAHTRCSGIIREAQKTGYNVKDEITDIELFKEPIERTLIKKLLMYPDTINRCIIILSPHYLANYLLDLAGLLHKYYDSCRVITDDKALSQARLDLVGAVKQVIHNGLALLSISAPEKM